MKLRSTPCFLEVSAELPSTGGPPGAKPSSADVDRAALPPKDGDAGAEADNGQAAVNTAASSPEPAAGAAEDEPSPDEEPPPMPSLFMYSVDFEQQSSGPCEASYVAAFDSPAIVPVPLPSSMEGSDVEVWAKDVGYAGVIAGVALVSSEAELLTWLASRGSSCSLSAPDRPDRACWDEAAPFPFSETYLFAADGCEGWCGDALSDDEP